MIRRSASYWTLLPQDVLGLHHGCYKVVLSLLPPGGEGAGAGELLAGVRVMREGGPLGPGPDVSLKKPLVRPIRFPVSPEHGVVGSLMERLFEQSPDH